VILPKRFKLHEAAGAKDGLFAWAAVAMTGHHLVASDGAVMAVVPILPPGTQNVDLPMLENGEQDGDCRLIPLPVYKAAVQGKTGEGRMVVDLQQARSQPAPGKPWTVAPLHEGEFPDSWADYQALSDGPEEAQMVEVILDAERLVRLARAIGAAEGVRLRFFVTRETGRMDGQTSAPTNIECRPAREPESGPWGTLGGQIVP
jgi:hypothetical protein